MIYFRGQSGNLGNVAFRLWYNNFQELRSLLPSQTPFIALTATAMKTTREKICSALNMNKPEFVMVSPERPNIMYGVLKMSNKIHVTEYFEWLLQMIKSKGNQSERCIIYCQTVNQCSTLYSLFLVCLGSRMYLNEEKRNPRERIVEMMHAKTPETVKETVLNSMASYDGHVRVLYVLLHLAWVLMLRESIQLSTLDHHAIWKVMSRRVDVAVEMASQEVV